jgi:carbon starvation protein CstA
VFVSLVIFALTFLLMLYGLFSNNGFSLLWRYFAWADQTTVAFLLAAATIYLIRKKSNYLITLIPGSFFTFICISFIIGSETQGLNVFIPSDYRWIVWIIAYSLGVICAISYFVILLKFGFKTRDTGFVEEPTQLQNNKQQTQTLKTSLK